MVDDKKETDFNSLCQWLEKEIEIYSLAEIHEKLLEISCSEAYGRKTLKQKLIERFGNNLTISSVMGKGNIVIFTSQASSIINDKWYQNRHENIEDEALRVVETAANLIIANIRRTHLDTEHYPNPQDIDDVRENIDFLPSYLRAFMEKLIKNPLRQASIG